MKAPDKIVFTGHHTDMENVCYIRKDTIIEYLKSGYEPFSKYGTSEYTKGCADTLAIVIDYIETLGESDTFLTNMTISEL